jgi:tRNA pseudouridine38-40 synthase
VAEKTLKLTLEYDGSGFRGWARQPEERTIEGVVRDALDAVFPSWAGLEVAGRTDTGVHATGQVASVRAAGGPPPENTAKALNAALPEDVAVLLAEEAEDDFSARFSARSRAYRYRILRRAVRSPFEARRALWWPKPIDRTALDAAAALLPGTHDFTAFTPSETKHTYFVRTVSRAEWLWVDDRLEFHI